MHDVIVVGGSLAGCATARFLAAAGARVLVLERAEEMGAYKKVCTTFIQPSAVPTLRRLGLVEPLEQAGALRNQAHMWTPWGWIRPNPESGGPLPSHGYNVHRSTLDPLVRHLAFETPGVTGLLDHTVVDLVRERRRVVGVIVRNGKGELREIRARLIVGADGRFSKVAELAGIEATARSNGRFVYFAFYEDLPLSSGAASQFWLDRDLGFAYPFPNGQTLVCAFIRKSLAAEWEGRIEDAFQEFFDRLPNAPKLATGRRVSRFSGMQNLTNLSRRPAAKGLALVGDAALAGDPGAGIGCGWAFQSAEWLADQVGAIVRADSPSSERQLDAALDRYARTHRRALAGHNYFINDLSSGRRFNLLEKFLFSAAATDEVFANHFGDYVARNIDWKQLFSPRVLFGAVLRLSTRNVRRLSA